MATVAAFGAAHLYGAVTYQKLHSFDNGAAIADGYHPGAPLVEGPDGFFYGVTQNGGGEIPNDCGTAFKVSSLGVFTLLHTFTADEGCAPTGLLLASSGLFYGTAVSSTSGFGTVFSMTADGTVVTLHEFNSGGGESPLYPLIEGTDGLFYGTTFAGGANGAGTAYRMDAAGNVTILHHFGDDADAGQLPSSGLLLATDGAFYGTTFMGGNAGAPGGTVYKMTVAGDVGTVTYLANFAVGGVDGHAPFGGLVEPVAGTFYGTTTSDHSFFGGTPVNRGTVFRLDELGLATVHTFSLDPLNLDGATPYGRLLFADDGNLYGMTLYGGTPSGIGGTVFRYPLVTPGSLEILHVFDGAVIGDTGSFPVAGLTQGTDGKIYGTTSGLTLFGNGSDPGTVFSLELEPIDPGVTLSDLALQPSTVFSGAPSTGTVTLNGAAPAGGVSVTLSSDNAIAQVSSPVVVPEGQTSVSFPITTTAFSGGGAILAEISASYGGVTMAEILIVSPAQLANLTLAPHSVIGGATSTATVTLTGAAPAGGLIVTITSDKPSAAASTSVLVAQGSITASTPITTFVVTSNANVKMTAQGGGVSVTAPLNVKRK